MDADVRCRGAADAGRASSPGGRARKRPCANFACGKEWHVAAHRGQAWHMRPGSTPHRSSSIFPADEPQYVILVKLDNPRSDIFGGKTAAPVSKIVLQAALAAKDASLDRAHAGNARVAGAASADTTTRLGRADRGRHAACRRSSTLGRAQRSAPPPAPRARDSRRARPLAPRGGVRAASRGLSRPAGWLRPRAVHHARGGRRRATRHARAPEHAP